MILHSSDLRLEGNLVTLIPLQETHDTDLVEAASDGELWNLKVTTVPNAETVNEYIQNALKQRDQKESIPFVVIYKPSGKVIGSTRYCNIDYTNRRVEIGYTWTAKSFQKTGVNTECKFLLLQHAFDVFNCIAVEFKTHIHNHESRRAIARIGAQQEGILRNHRIGKDGSVRDTVLFSIIDTEWPHVKASLQQKMTQY